MILTVVVHVQAVFERFLVLEHTHSKNGAKNLVPAKIDFYDLLRTWRVPFTNDWNV